MTFVAVFADMSACYNHNEISFKSRLLFDMDEVSNNNRKFQVEESFNITDINSTSMTL